jgi:ADP-ribosylglycohydrolase
MLAAAYQHWRHTQGEPETRGVRVPLDGWLLGHRFLRARCAPDATSLRALAGTANDPGDRAEPGRSCGAVMRVAPIGLFVASFAGRGEPEAAARAFRLGIASAAITHAHPSAQLSAGAMAMLVARLVQRAPLERALADVRAELVRHAAHRETLAAIELAVLLAREDPVGVDTVMRLGDGFDAPSALAIALYCALVATTLEDGVIVAVNHSGKSATTGALAGQLLGAIHGVAAIPERWIAELEAGELVREVADDLASVARWALDDAGAASCPCRRKYPGR